MYRLTQFLAVVTALIGGLVLLTLVLMTTASIIGRFINGMLHGDFFQGALNTLAQAVLDLGIGEINGNYELLEAGVAFAIFSFLPICQFYGSHASRRIHRVLIPAHQPLDHRLLGGHLDRGHIFDHLAALRGYATLYRKR